MGKVEGILGGGGGGGEWGKMKWVWGNEFGEVYRRFDELWEVGEKMDGEWKLGWG